MSKGKQPTYKDVTSAAEQLLAEGFKVTPDSIAKLLEVKTTSPEIAAHLEAWKSSLGEDVDIRDLTPAGIIELLQIREKELERTLALVRSTLESTNDGILVVSNDGRVVDFNEHFLQLWGLSTEVMENGKEPAALKIVKEQLVDPERFVKEVFAMNDDLEGEGACTDLHFKDGRVYERYSQPHRVGGEIVGRVWSLRDVTERRRSEEALQLRQRAIEASPDAVMITDLEQKDQPIIYVNPAFKTITGYGANEALGKSYEFLFGKEQKQVGVIKLQRAIKSRKEESVDVRCYKKDGELFWSELHIAPVFETLTDMDTKETFFATEKDSSRVVVGEKVSHYVNILTDVTERKAMEEQLIHQATHDALTNLPNRLLLKDRLHQAIRHAKRENVKVGVLFLDLDYFKLVNDSLGHTVGDVLLNRIASCLKKTIRATDTVARIGGDEFIILLSDIKDENIILKVIEKIYGEIRQPIQIDEHELNITGSFGISIYPKDGHRAELLLRNADTAMYQAKDNGRNGFSFFEQDMNVRASRHLNIRNYLVSALDNDEFRLVYQPLLDLKTNKISGFEALLRWKNKAMGQVSPVEFLPIAEDTGLIHPIGAWVFRTACQQLVAWHKSGMKHLDMSINLSGTQLCDADIAAFGEVIKEQGVDPGAIIIEITESTLMDPIQEVADRLNAIKSLGMQLSIDDFGTGYSSLSYLKNIPANELKIDRAFIQDIVDKESDVRIVKAIIAMAKSLGMRVVGEGVETKEQFEFLKQNGCDILQGFYFEKPLSTTECTTLLKSKSGS